MSFATITGTLKDAFGIVIPNQELLFEATKTSETVLNNTSAKVVTDSVGGYSVELNFGTYTLKTKQVREATYKTVASNILVYSTSYSGRDLQYLLLSQADLQNIDQSLIDQLLTIKIDVYAARDETILNAQEAVASETNAAASASAALISKNAAATSATSASSSANAAASSATNAATSATSASSSATSAASSATSALASKNAAAASETNAAISATNASSSATAASDSATSAASSATSATASKNAAATSETNAATSATSASSSATAAASSASSALTSKNAAATSATNAATSETNALTSKNAAASSATNAATSATAAATSAVNASTSASNAATSATLAGNYAAMLASVVVVPYTPAVNPTLDLDFAKQKYKWYAGAAGLTESSTPSLMTFTRSSIAKYFDAMGVMRDAAVDTPRIDFDPVTGQCLGLLIEESRTNLLTYSQKMIFSGWSFVNGSRSPSNIACPDGTLSGLLSMPIANYWRTDKNISIANDSSTYTFSVYVKPSGTTTNFYIDCGFSGGTTVEDLVGVYGSGATYNTSSTKTVTSVGNGWYRLAITLTNNSTGNTSAFMRLMVNGGMNTGTWWGAQLEVGAFPTSYIQSAETWSSRASSATYLDSNGVLQTAASGVARSNAYDYDSDGVLRPIGLLLEPSATNLLLYSEQLDNAAWIKTNVTVTPNATTAPDGTTTADKIVESAVAGIHEVNQAYFIPTDTYASAKILLKKAERNYAVIRLSGNSKRAACVVDLTTGAYTVTNWMNTLNTSVSVALRPDGWVRVVLTSQSNYATSPGWTSITVSPADSFVDATSVGSSGYSYTGDGVSGIYMWAAQVENNSYATSYIQTTSAQVTRVADTSTSAQATRAADIALINQANTSLWLNPREGSLVSISDSKYLAGTGVNASAVCSMDDGTTNNRISLFAAESSVTLTEIITGGVAQAKLQQTGVSVGVKRKAALSYTKDSFSSSADGSASVSDTSGTVPNVKQLRLGRIFTDGQLNGHIRSLKYFPKALSSIELQAMTA